MPLDLIKRVVGRAVHVPGEDIDTDRIIPARYLRCVTFDGLGEGLFQDVRYRPDGTKTGHPLDDPRYAGATIMVSGRNFGCGSSREHAPQAIVKAGFKAIIAESFAEIFFGNATTLGIPCVSLGRSDLDALAAHLSKMPAATLTIDLETQAVAVEPNLSYPFSIKPAAREVLLRGVWDPIGQLLDGRDAASDLAKTLPYLHFA
jgi:3-isopropylmalate/(R)-2-methylmalate dehydratase small subunit